MAKLESKRSRRLNSGQELPNIPESKPEPEVYVTNRTLLTKDAFFTFSVPSDGSCLFWAVAMAYLLPVRNHDTSFTLRFEELFGEREKTEVTYVRELIDNYNFQTLYEDQALQELVSNAFRNRVVDEMTEQEAEVHHNVTLDDFLRARNDGFVVGGAFRKRFRTAFLSETRLVDLNRLKPDRLNDKSIELMNTELDKLSDKNLVQKLMYDSYLESMRNRKSWGGRREIRAIEKLLECQILVFSKDNTNFSIDRSVINICLFNTNELSYEFGLVKAEVIIEALKNKNYQSAADLINLGVDKINFQDENGNSVLHFAIHSDNKHDLINKLVFQGANLNLRNKLKKTPSDLANEFRLKQSIAILENYAKQIKENYSSIDRNRHKISVVVVLPVESANPFKRETVNAKRALDQQKRMVEAPSVFYNDNGLNALHLAAAEGNEGIVKLLLSTSGQHPLLTHDLLEAPTRDEKRQRALHLAVLNERSKVVECLIEHGAEVNAKDFSVDIQGKDFHNAEHPNWTPLHYAAERGRLEIVRALAERGKAEVDVVDYSGGTPLQRAVKHGHLHVVKYLVSMKAEVKSKDRTKVCVLSYAARAGREDVIDELLANGAEVNSLDQHGMSPAQHAANCQQWNAVKRLVERGADVNIEDNNRKTLLARVVKAGKWDVVRYLLEKGALFSGGSWF